MRRFYLPPGSITGGTATLPPDEARHLTAVLRLKSGEEVELFDGTGIVYTARLEYGNRQRTVLRILSSRRDRQQPAIPPLTVVQGILKGKKMDMLIQKATEMGVHAFRPLLTLHCEGHAKSSQQERWQRIMLAACKQCGRNRPMDIYPPVHMADLHLPPTAAGILLWEKEQHAVLTRSTVADSGAVWLAVGPEGGFHVEEIDRFLTLGFATFSLGNSTLRAETATIAGIAIVQHLLDAFTPFPA